MIISPTTPIKNGKVYDVCILGGGVAGIICALELSRINKALSICIVESGGLKAEEKFQALNEGENRSKVLNKAENPISSRVRALGGTTNVWAGHMSVFEDENFNAYPWAPNSGWPLRKTDLDPFYERVGSYFHIEPSFDIERWQNEKAFEVSFNEKPLTQKIWQRLRVNFGSRAYRKRLEQASQIDLYLETTCINLSMGDNAEVNNAQCVRGEERITIMAQRYVLAMGGLENARFLLNQVDKNKDQLPLTQKNVGRYFSVHPIFYFGSALFTGDLAKSDLYNDRMRSKPKGSHVVAYLKVPRREREAHKWLDAYFQCSAPLKPEASRKLASISHLTSGDHIVHRIMAMVCEMATRRENHVGLTNTLDKYGQKQLYIDLSLDELTLRSYREQITYFAEALGANDAGRINLNQKMFEETLNGKQQLWGGHHHMCTTRMSETPEDGVVDKNCKVHDCDNLYVIGGSSFSTGGIANPTYTIGALAARLSAHLSEQM